MAAPYDGKTIVVVDDDPDILAAINAALGDSGAKLLTASAGNAGLRLIEQNKPDVVILDIMLPEKSGFLVLEKLRQGIPRNDKPHIIMITGNQGKRHQQYAESLGIREYLHKPFSMEVMIEKVEKWLKA
ncbi:MAG: response regulator [Phycisphaerae bacterium]|nr:response regulator [Phycisphaerae bacterium]